jgi:hypothetical protein
MERERGSAFHPSLVVPGRFYEHIPFWRIHPVLFLKNLQGQGVIFTEPITTWAVALSTCEVCSPDDSIA